MVKYRKINKSVKLAKLITFALIIQIEKAWSQIVALDKHYIIVFYLDRIG